MKHKHRGNHFCFFFIFTHVSTIERKRHVCPVQSSFLFIDLVKKFPPVHYNKRQNMVHAAPPSRSQYFHRCWLANAIQSSSENLTCRLAMQHWSPWWCIPGKSEKDLWVKPLWWSIRSLRGMLHGVESHEGGTSNNCGLSERGDVEWVIKI